MAVTTEAVNGSQTKTRLRIPATTRAPIVVAVKGADGVRSFKGAAELIGRRGEVDESKRIVCKHNHSTNAEATPCAESLTRENQTY